MAVPGKSVGPATQHGAGRMPDREFAQLQMQRDAAPRGRQKADLTRRVNNEMARRKAEPVKKASKPLSPDLERSWDKRSTLAQRHSGRVVSETPDSSIAEFLNVKRADAYYDEMVSRGFEVDMSGLRVIVRRRAAEY